MKNFIILIAIFIVNALVFISCSNKSDIEEKLKQIKSLQEKGLISEKEYNKQKDILLSQLIDINKNKTDNDDNNDKVNISILNDTTNTTNTKDKLDNEKLPANYIVTTDQINVRAEPTTDAEIWEVLFKDVVIEVKENTGIKYKSENIDSEWVKIKTATLGSGYIIKEFIKPAPDKKLTSPEKLNTIREEKSNELVDKAKELISKGKKDAAKNYVETALKTFPKNEEAKLLMDKIEGKLHPDINGIWKSSTGNIFEIIDLDTKISIKDVRAKKSYYGKWIDKNNFEYTIEDKYKVNVKDDSTIVVTDKKGKKYNWQRLINGDSSDNTSINIDDENTNINKTDLVKDSSVKNSVDKNTNGKETNITKENTKNNVILENYLNAIKEYCNIVSKMKNASIKDRNKLIDDLNNFMEKINKLSKEIDENELSGTDLGYYLKAIEDLSACVKDAQKI